MDWGERQKGELAGGRLLVEELGPVVVLTVNRPEALNALDLEAIEGLGVFVEMMERHPTAAAVVLTGAPGQCFISGGDLRQLATLRGERAGRALSGRMGEILARLEALPQTVIAAMDGDAYGGGVEVALACDLRVIGRGSKMALTQARFGLTTGWGASHRLVRAVGYSRALELLLETRPVDAEEARALGLVNRVVDDGQALIEARAWAERVAALTRPVALGIKQVVQSAANMATDDALAEERYIFGRLWAAPHHEARVDRFLARREGEES